MMTQKSHFPDHLLKRARIGAQSQFAGAVGQLNSISEVRRKSAQRKLWRRVPRPKMNLESHFPAHLLKTARISAQSQLAGAFGQLNSISEILGKIAQRA